MCGFTLVSTCRARVYLRVKSGLYCHTQDLAAPQIAHHPAPGNRSHSQITSFILNTGDEVEWPAYLLFSFSNFLSHFIAVSSSFGIWPPPSVSVKTIGCEIENNHVERDWDGSSLSSSLSLSMDSWLLLIKSTRD